jgi:hypothetical protein
MWHYLLNYGFASVERRRLACVPLRISRNPKKMVAECSLDSGARILTWRLHMNELTQRLTVDQPIVMGGADPTVEELSNRTGEMGYVLVKFTETRGGTELGFPLDRETTDISGANFEEATGTVHVEGNLILNDDPVRCIADIDLSTLQGTGRLELEEKVPVTVA